ncbi:MAG: LytR/AlgR family response regulator transcription factor [Gemmatimonadaceae bacterium]
MKVRCLVVDDEPLGRERIISLLRSEPEAEVVGERDTGRAAVRAIIELAPDLVFLDVQMPELDGFGVLAALPPPNVPAVIFVTAHDEYAIRAFDVHAQDYLLKPFDRDRFHLAFARAAQRLRGEHSRGADKRLLALLTERDRQQPRRARIPIRSAGSVFFLPVDDVDWLEAADNYVRIHAKGETHMVRQTLQHMERTLPADMFVRIHRSIIVNVERIREIQPWFGGEFVVLLRNGAKVHTSRSYRSRLETLMK